MKDKSFFKLERSLFPVKTREKKLTYYRFSYHARILSSNVRHLLLRMNSKPLDHQDFLQSHSYCFPHRKIVCISIIIIVCYNFH